jgi:hypothetical protein
MRRSLKFEAESSEGPVIYRVGYGSELTNLRLHDAHVKARALRRGPTDVA